MLPSTRVAVERKLEHARDGARRIMNSSEDKTARTIARNVAITCDDALKLVTSHDQVVVDDEQDGFDLGV